MKIVDQTGDVVFDFGHDQLGEAILYKIAVIAKFPTQADRYVTVNPVINGMIKAIGERAERRPVRTFAKTNDPVFYTDDQFANTREVNVAKGVLKAEAAFSGWNDLEAGKKQELVECAFFPLPVTEHQIQKTIEDFDKWFSPKGSDQ